MAALVLVAFGTAAQVNLDHIIRLGEFPRVSEEKPIVGALHLPAILKGLFEDAVLITNAITGAGDIERGEGIEEAGCQAPKPAIAQTRFNIEGDDLLKVKIEFGGCLLRQLPGVRCRACFG